MEKRRKITIFVDVWIHPSPFSLPRPQQSAHLGSLTDVAALAGISQRYSCSWKVQL
jgi:hypothetical protein